MTNIVLFDGTCNFCDKSVQFIIKRDPRALLSFASLQSDVGKELIAQYGIPEAIDSFVLIEGDKYYIKSTAALKVCRYLHRFWKIATICLIVPRPLRDWVYGIIAKNRFKWFGTKDHCMLPTPEERKRFL